MQKIRNVLKHATCVLATIGAILVGVSHIWQIPHIYQIGQVIAVIVGVLGTGWLCDKAYKNYYSDKSVNARLACEDLKTAGYDKAFIKKAKKYCKKSNIYFDADFFIENSNGLDDGERDGGLYSELYH